MKPWHDTTDCPHCKGPVVPFEGWRTPTEASNPSHLKCAACGKDWDEDDLRIILQAWYSHGAWEGHEEAKAEVHAN